MPEHLAYARRASGLVRGLSLFDAFGVGFMNQGLVPSIQITVTLGLSVFLGGNLIIAAIISVILAGFGFTLTWGILGGSMPRSGGEYIYNSRVLHPLIGIGQSFGDAVIWLLWIATLAPLAVSPGLRMTFEFLGMPGMADWVNQPYAMFLLASVINVAAFCAVAFGIRIFARVQRVFVIFGLAGATAMGLVLTFTSHATFVHHWDALASKGGPGALTYDRFLSAVSQKIAESGSVLPGTWNWHDTFGVMLAMSWLFAYGYSISFIGGEVKRPERNMLWANLWAILVPFFFIMWIAIGLYHSVGFRFLSAAAWYDQFVQNHDMSLTALQGYALPWSSHVYGLVVVMTGGNRLIGALIGIAFVAFCAWWVALSYLAFPRTLFAWGMDRMGPKWFTDIDPRYATPLKNHVLCLVLGEALIFLYTFVYRDMMGNITLTGMQITSVFAVTALAAIFFPYSPRARAVWQNSPYRTWRFAGVPLVVWGGIVALVYVGILLFMLFVMQASEAFTLSSLVIFILAWVLGIVWYFVWKGLRGGATAVTSTYTELPPE